MTEFLAVDAGGTSTRSAVVAPDGRVLGYGRAGGGNPVSSGPEAAAASVAASAAQAVAGSGVEPVGVRRVVLAMAGGSTQLDLEVFRAPLRALGVDAPLALDSDLLAMFCSGTWLTDGYGLVAGTGAAAIRVQGGREVAGADGLGWLLGDDGSGFWIGHRVARAALAALDGRGPATALAPLLLEHLGIAADATVGAYGRPASLSRAIEALYARRPVELAGFARLAFDAAGDPVADAIVRDAAAALEATLEAVASPELTGPIVLGGGTLVGHPELAGRIAAARTRDGVAPEVHTVADGLVGAAVLTLRAAGHPVDRAVFETISGSLAALR